jgi:spermidine/putrescine transport system permease protein
LYIPILIVILYSFNEAKSGAAWTGVSLKWYADMLDDSALIRAFGVSLRVALFSALISGIIGTLGAFAVGRLKNRFRAVLNGLIYIPLIVPEIVLGVAFLTFFSILPVGYDITTLVISHSAFCIPYVYVLVEIRLRSFDKSILEAARELGAKGFTLFRTIIFPIIAPAVFSGLLLSVAMSLDDVIISSFVARPKAATLPMLILSSLRLGTKPRYNALCTVIFVISLTAVTVLQLANSRRNSNGGSNSKH